LALVAAWTIWTVPALAFNGALFLESTQDDFLCTEYGLTDSDYGEAYWSFVPPGTGCHYTARQHPPHGKWVEPPTERLIPAGVLGATGIGVVLLHRSFRRRYPATNQWRDRVLASTE
jgi:hypothetical protein